MEIAYTTEEDIALLIVSIIIIITNLAEINLLMKHRKRFVPYEQLLLSLSICDLCVGISMFIFSIMDLSSGSQAEKINLKEKGTTPIWLSILLSVSHVNWLTIDRSIAVSRPLRHKIWITYRNTAVVITFTWFTSIALVAIQVSTVSFESSKHFLKDAASSACFTVILVYSHIIYKVYVQRRKKLGNSTNISQRQAKEHRLVFICLLISVLFLATNLPFIIQIYLKKNSFGADLTLVCSSLFNPFIYYFWKYFEQRHSNQN